METFELELDHGLRSFRLSLRLELGAETVALVGPSGAGKSSVLRAVAGLLRPERGVVRLGEELWLDTAGGIDLPPERRRVGLVFQEYALFPHLSVRANVEFGGRARAAELLDRFRIAGLADARPTAISGGERQRVALGRALLYSPLLLLLDEPLSSLDDRLKQQILPFLKRVKEETRIPMIYVTHSRPEVDYLADRVLTMESGRLLA